MPALRSSARREIPWLVGYCTNIHAGTTRDQIAANLRDYCGRVRAAIDVPRLPVGLWIPDSAVAAMAADAAAIRGLLAEQGLQPYTINAFPQANFHGDVVKHSVYQPDWSQPSRRDYTIAIADLMVQLMQDEPLDRVGSISTLPIGWQSNPKNSSVRGRLQPSPSDAAMIRAAGEQFRAVAKHLQQIFERTGRRITVAIEPEPGCVIDHWQDAVQFFESELPDAVHRQHISICHDVCHASVMMQPQPEVIAGYAAAGIEIGKIQISSGIVAPWDRMANARRREAIEQLALFAEDRYLHQIGRRTADGHWRMNEDLPDLIRTIRKTGDPVDGDQTWIVHFHVPIFLDRFGHLETTQDDIHAALAAITGGSDVVFTGHVEVETYAWTVLPDSMRRRELVDDIADELRWLSQRLEA